MTNPRLGASWEGFASANGLPLGAESNDKFFKILMADTGLVSVQLDLSSIPYPQAGDLIFTSKGDPVVCTLVSIPLYLA